MPTPTRAQFDAAAAKVAATAPAGLSRDQFFDLVDRELATTSSTAGNDQPGSSGGLTTAALANATPAAATAAEEFATNPAVPKMAAKAGRVMGGIAPVIAGAVEGGPIGALVGVAASSKGAWAGGRTGWFTGKLAQNVAAPVASILRSAAPYVKTLSTLSGVQSIGDLAQMADPSRRDIGVAGIGPTVHVPGEKPALINAAIDKIGQHLRMLLKYGLSTDEAAALLLDTQNGGK